ncbi:MAG: DUF389 domain-containing protein [Solirubrobacterales bacterium]
MIHLRVIAPTYECENVVDLLKATPSVTNLIFLPGAASKPEGSVILCDVAREDASVVIGDLKELNVHREGSIAIEEIDSQISEAADRAEKAAAGAPSDAVVWEEVESRTSESTELSANFLAFMVLAMLLAASAIFLDSTIVIIGAMVVGPEFGPLAGLCVAVAERRMDVGRRSLWALAVGFPVGITSAFAFSLVVRWTGLAPGGFEVGENTFTQFISQPDVFSFIIAFFAGMVGVLSLTSTKSAALIGVLISVTTIPAAANIGLAAAYGDGGEWVGAMAQLSLNLTAIVLAGIATLYVQRLLYVRRRRAHLHDQAREIAGLPMGRSRRQPVGTGTGRSQGR